MTRVKVCGITDVDDARDAVALGADAIGINFSRSSPRYVEPGQANRIIESLPPLVTAIGVFVNHGDPHSLEDFGVSMRLSAVQLHGDETPEYCSLIQQVKVIKAFRVDSSFRPSILRAYRSAAFLLDAYHPDKFGGTGQVFDWRRIEGADAFGRIILAGGLTPENVGGAVERSRPFAVDVSSGVEEAAGQKNYDKMRRFIEAVRGADAPFVERS